jgi:regulator of sigma E protease
MLEDFLQQLGYLLAFAAVLGSLVFFHELGHFVAAVKLGVRVKEFGIGFPPRLLGTARDTSGRRRWFFGYPPQPKKIKQPALMVKDGKSELVDGIPAESASYELDPNDVIYSINWLPLGGFVRPAGEDDPTVPNGLSASPKRVRFTVLAAGPAANLIIGLLVFTLGYAIGWPNYRVKIVNVVPEAPATAAGLRAGDIVLSANGEDVSFIDNDLTNVIRSNLGKPVVLVIERGGQRLNMIVTPRTEWPEGQGPTGIELGFDTQLIHYSLPLAAWHGASEVAFQIRETVMLPVRWISGQIKTDEVRFVSIVGLKDINDAAVDTARELGQWYPIIRLVGTITVALALTNLLPLPALDGGRILFVLLEALRGRRIAPEREGLVHLMGMMVLLVLMAMLILNDLRNPIIPR